MPETRPAATADRSEAEDLEAPVTRADETRSHGPRRGAAEPATVDETLDPETRAIVRRLRSVEGHVRGVERMVADGAYCMDVMNQILAVERALKKVSGLVLDRHLHTCVTRALRGDDPEERERVIEEVMEVFQSSARR